MIAQGWTLIALVACGQAVAPAEPPLQFQAPSAPAQAEEPTPAAPPPPTDSEVAPAKSFGAPLPEEPAALSPETPEVATLPARQSGEAADELYTLIARAQQLGLEGQPTPLLQVLSAADARARRDVVVAYWQLACAMLDYQYRADEAGQFQTLAAGQEGAGNAPLELRAAAAAATARQTDARVRVLEAQQRLSSLLPSPLREQSLLASDAPHAGPYGTKFEALFSGRSAPPNAWLLNRVLPLRHQEVTARLESVDSAEQAVAASRQAMKAGMGDSLGLLNDLMLLASVRRTLVDSLRQYNQEIADYALGVVSPPDIQTVAAMLIKPRGAQPIASTVAPAGDAVQRTQFEQQQRAGQPAVRPNQELNPPPSAPRNSSELQPTPDEGAGLTAEDAAELMADTRVFSALVGVDSFKQTQRLVTSLYRAGEANPTSQSGLSLLQVLQATASNPLGRQELVADYWRTNECLARRHVLEDVAVQLETLLPVAEQRSGEMPDVHTLRAAERAARADVLATDAALAVQQFRLTTALGRDVSGPWLTPITPPHAGRYLPKTESFAAHGALVNQAKLLSATHERLVDESAAIVDLDLARSAAVAAYANETGTLREALTALTRQTELTLELLAGATQYNQLIASYAFSVLPANTPPELAHSALVAERG